MGWWWDHPPEIRTIRFRYRYSLKPAADLPAADIRMTAEPRFMTAVSAAAVSVSRKATTRPQMGPPAGAAGWLQDPAGWVGSQGSLFNCRRETNVIALYPGLYLSTIRYLSTGGTGTVYGGASCAGLLGILFSWVKSWHFLHIFSSALTVLLIFYVSFINLTQSESVSDYYISASQIFSCFVFKFVFWVQMSGRYRYWIHQLLYKVNYSLLVKLGNEDRIGSIIDRWIIK